MPDYAALAERVGALEREARATRSECEATKRRLARAERLARAAGAGALLLLGALLVSLSARGAEAQQTGLSWRVLLPRLAALEAKTSALSRVGNELFITGVNVHVRDGSGLTDSGMATGGPGSGRGNLIIGYNEPRVEGGDVPPPDVRTGAHNLVLGGRNNFSSYGCLIAGYSNSVTAPYAGVTGGFNNRAIAPHASVTGGNRNTAGGFAASVGGGYNNHAVSDSASVTGGYQNTAGGPHCWVGGGANNAAGGDASAVSGGSGNRAGGDYASVGGGNGNTARGNWSSVAGGQSNMAASFAASVGGGAGNTASGETASVSGGRGRSVTGNDDWRAGGHFQEF